MTARAAQMTVGSIALLAAWLGAALIIAAVGAPAAFAVLPTRALAGALVGRALPAVFTTGVLVAVVLLVTHRLAESGRLVGGMGSLMFLAIGAANVVALRIAAMRASIGVPIDSLDPSDSRRMAFGRMHGLSVILLGLGMLCAFVALVALSRHLLSRSSP